MRATDIAALIRQKKLSAREVMQAHLRQIERINPKVNAIVTLVPEDQLLAQARAADEAVMKGRTGSLHGLPVGVKDIVETKGIRTTYGSPLYKDFVPDFDALVVERVKNAGAIVIGKTNVPEFAFGARTWNPVFGPTFNPYDLTKTCGAGLALMSLVMEEEVRHLAGKRHEQHPAAAGPPLGERSRLLRGGRAEGADRAHASAHGGES